MFKGAARKEHKPKEQKQILTVEFATQAPKFLRFLFVFKVVWRNKVERQSNAPFSVEKVVLSQM